MQHILLESKIPTTFLHLLNLQLISYARSIMFNLNLLIDKITYPLYNCSTMGERRFDEYPNVHVSEAGTVTTASA